MSKFQLILLGVFGVIIIASVIIFSRYQGSSQQTVHVSVWGTISNSQFNEVIAKTSLFNSKILQVEYAEKSPDTIDSEFVEALAAGQGPDLLVLPQDKITKQKNKLYAIPYTSYSERSFKDTFIEGAEIYLLPEGVLALPIVADPLVMYWNRDIFTESKKTQPPKYWDELYNFSQVLSKKDNSFNIFQSAVSFGEYANVAHAKEIISTLMMQSGTPIVSWSADKPISVLAYRFDKPLIPAEAAVNFYTEFSNPTKPFYSWNRSLPNSATYFLSSNLGLYFGFAGELFNIQLKNPNLNFDVAPVPNSREGDAGAEVSFGKFLGLAISRGSKNATAAFQVISVLTSPEGAQAFVDVLSLPPARRDLLSVLPTDPYKTVFYTSAIRSRAWLDPDPAESDKIFQDMIESITSGRERTSAAVARASNALGNLFK